MGASIAKWLYYKGADVFYLSFGKHDVPQGVYTLEVESSSQMKEYLSDAIRVAKKGKLSQVTMQSGPQTLIQKKPLLFMVAAVSDYVPKFPQEGKLKKQTLGSSWNLELTQNEDILSTIDKTDITVIGFKAETDATQASTNAKEMLQNKNIDAVCLNVLRSSSDFGTNDNEITFFTKDQTVEFGRDKKENLAYKLLESCKDL
jgi:phosphopantothenoylcysteine decarboxylase/phosphopantothenate--cysteine ligase